jgi:hypothetical protein
VRECASGVPSVPLASRLSPLAATTITTYSKGSTTILAAYVDVIERMIMDSGLHHASVLPVGVGVGVVDVHGNSSGDIDSLLSSSDAPDHVAGNGSDNGKPRRLLEPYERHRAHDLRAECYRRGIRPIKKGPNANDNKNGYIVLLRKFDGTSPSANGLSPDDRSSLLGGGGPATGAGPHGHSHSGGENEDDTDENDALDGSGHMGALVKKRKLPSSQQQHLQQQPHGNGTASLTHAAVAAAAAAANDLAGFYDTTSTPLVPVLPMQYPNLVKPPSANATATASDLEILSGIANTYTTQPGTTASGSTTQASGGGANDSAGMFCGNCRTIVTDQLMESIRLGRNKMQMIEFQRLMDQRDRDTIHLKETITVLRDLRRSLRDAQNENRLTHELLVEYEDDIAFFQNLKERTKDRMRKEMQERAAKQANAGNVGTT